MNFDFIKSISIRSLLVLMLGILVLPGLGVAIATSITKSVEGYHVQQVQQDILDIDNLLRDRLSAPFYLQDVDPCSPDTLQLIKTTSLDMIAKITNRPSELCIWEYRDHSTHKVLARDYWGFRKREPDLQNSTVQNYWGYLRFLQKREYYKDDRLIATDIFDWQNSDRFKCREYPDSQYNEECYSEAGKLRTEDPQNTVLSPVPPITYWFFYR